MVCAKHNHALLTNRVLYIPAHVYYRVLSPDGSWSDHAYSVGRFRSFGVQHGHGNEPRECYKIFTTGPPSCAADFTESALPPDDSDAWLFDGETELTRAMRERESEMETYAREQAERRSRGPAGEGSPEEAPGEASFDTTRVVDTMKKFVESMSSYEGAEVPPGAGGGTEGPEINLDMDKFMTELEAALGLGSKGGETEEGDGLDSDLDSDMDWDEGGESEARGSDEGGSARPEAAGPSSRMREAREVGGGSEEGESDSDDSFMEEYGEVGCCEFRLLMVVCAVF